MIEKLTLKDVLFYLVLTVILSGIAIFSMGLDENIEKLIVKEGGFVETASAIGYGICLLFLFYLGRKDSLKSHWYLYLIILAMCLRELDFDKRFTETGILKSRFLTADNVGLFAKILGASVLLVLLTAIFFWARRHLRAFFSGLIRLDRRSITAGFVMAYIVFAKSLDGLARKLAPLGFEVSDYVHELSIRFEELFELGVPVLMMWAIFLYWKGSHS